jgi:hypothetical protein
MNIETKFIESIIEHKYMSKTKITIFIVLFSTFILKAQEEQPKYNPIKAHSISLKLLGSPTYPLGISYSQMISNRLSMEIGVGILSTGVGVDYYITNPRKHRFNLNIGLNGSYNYDGFPMIYIPLGFSYLSKGSFQFNLNAGLLYSENVSSNENGKNISPWFGLTISKRFGKDIESLKNEQKTELSNIISLRLGFVLPFIGINYERLLTPNIGLEASIGLIGASAGANVYFPSIKPGKIGFKTGLTQGVMIFPFLGIETSTYLPFGINYLSKSCYVLSIDVGPQYWLSYKDLSPGYTVKIGKLF